ncbi:hypothetical protein [Streptomyces sp. NBC_00328]|uniref:hypothetical protein n=1 Tax=Streptomyces sp. NBC_00328 TaxID=2903646 RepID=UPI002E2A2E18|nr:hypothetical protein [Streptomyces sp. NBC_00328]
MSAEKPSDGGSVRDGIARMEGYLLWQGEVERALAEAESFADQLDWLTTAQREEVVDLFTRHQLALSRTAITRTARRALQLRQEYQDRYDFLRRQVFAGALALGTATVFVNCLLQMR